MHQEGWCGGGCASCYDITRFRGIDQGEGTDVVERVEECMIPSSGCSMKGTCVYGFGSVNRNTHYFIETMRFGVSLCLEMLEGSLCLTILGPLCAEMLCLSGDTRARLRAATISARAATAVTQIQHTFNITKPLYRKILGARARL
jgi:hypothetical protein